MVALQGEIWWARLPDPVGSGPGFTRPVIVVQSDPFNNSRLRTILVVILTSNMGRADSPGNVVISKSASGLSKDSVANVTQIIAADKGILTEKVGKISHRKLQQIQQGIKLVLGLNS